MPLIQGKNLTKKQLGQIARLIRLLQQDHRQYDTLFGPMQMRQPRKKWYKRRKFFVDDPQDIHAVTALLPRQKYAVGGQISDVVVDPQYRCRGLARQLLTQAIQASRASGDKKLGITYMADNKNAIKLYQSVGFKPNQTFAMLAHDAQDKSHTASPTQKARAFMHAVHQLAQQYQLPVFAVTQGASVTANKDSQAVRNARNAHVKWQRKNGHDPQEDWSK